MLKNIIVLIISYLFITACNNSNSLNNFSFENVNTNNFIKISNKDFSNTELREIYSKSPNYWPKPELGEGVEYREIGVLPPVNFPNNNTFTYEKSKLGEKLFFDKRLSGSKNLACASCHNPKQGWSDGKDTSNGHMGKKLKRNSPSILNTAYNKFQFWDGRASSLEEQAVAVLLNPDEMHNTKEQIENDLNNIKEYKEEFNKVFGTKNVQFQDVIKSLATFERTVVTKNKSPFDKFILGDKNSLSDSALRGMHLYRTKARCMNCHNGANFTDNQFHNLSLTYYGTDMEDLGRFYVTKQQKDWGTFKTPSLRNAINSAPYMHNGIFINMKKVLTKYNEGLHGSDPNKSKLIVAINLTEEELDDLNSFIESLNEN